ncbi:MAG: hypothetical protein ACKV0T_21225 [Planctomycetales bacterium]
MHRLTARWLCAALWLGGWGVFVPLSPLATAAFGDEQSTGITAPPAAEPGVLLLRTGATIEGRILKSGANYEVYLAHGGRMFVPGEQVRQQGGNLKEIYRKLRESVQKDETSSGHVTLARWCVTNHLLSDARTELNDALSLDAGNSEARNLLHKLDDLANPSAKGESKSSRSSKPVVVSHSAQSDDQESLGGLSREMAQQFTRKIQPILVNNCAAAGCHGANSESDFRLQRVLPGSLTSRVATERNLASVLQQIDPKTPRKSPLLTTPTGNHGRHGKAPFSGPRGADQLADLKAWVQRVAKSEVVRSKREPTPARGGGRIEQVSGTADRNSARKPKIRTVSEAEPQEPEQTVNHLLPTNDPFGELETQPSQPTRSPPRRRDPFDPTDFNQRSATPAARR